MKNKRILSLLLAIAMVTGLSACGINKENANNKSDVASQKSSSAESSTSLEVSKEPSIADTWVPDENKTYVYDYCYYQTAPIADDPEMFPFWKDNFNVEFNVWDIDHTQATELIANRIIGGEIPDKFSVYQYANFRKYAEEGIIAEIPMEMLETYAPHLLAAIERSVPEALDYCKIDGKLYGLPVFSFGSVARAPVAWRMDWLKAVGIEKVPETLDEFEEAVYAFTFDDPDGNGKDDTYGLSNSILTAVYGAYGYIPYDNNQGVNLGGLWQERDGHLVQAAVQPEMKEALERIAKWYADGVVDPEFITGENQGGYWALSHSFINGRIGVSGMGQTYHWQPALYEDSAPGQNIQELLKIDPDAEVAVGIPPKGPYGQGTFANGIIVEEKMVFGVQMGEEPDRMAKLLSVYDWIYESYDNYVVATSGIEGTHWEYMEKTSTFDGITEKIVVSLGDWSDGKVRSSNFAGSAMSIFNPIWEDVTEGAGIRWARSIGADKYRYNSELYTSLPSAGEYQADLNSLVEETYYAIITGTKPVDYFETFVEEWYARGGDILVKEANEWYQTVKGN